MFIRFGAIQAETLFAGPGLGINLLSVKMQNSAARGQSKYAVQQTHDGAGAMIGVIEPTLGFSTHN